MQVQLDDGTPVEVPNCSCGRNRQTEFRWYQREDGLEASVVFTPGYRCLNTGPRSHGIHGMEIMWSLRGGGVGVSLTAFTDWVPGSHSPRSTHDLFPMNGGLFYHLTTPVLGGQEPVQGCRVIDGPCYSDVSYLRGDDAIKDFVERGEQAVWECLEDALADARERTQSAEAHKEEA